jgi:hypothetical protein
MQDPADANNIPGGEEKTEDTADAMIQMMMIQRRAIMGWASYKPTHVRYITMMRDKGKI